MKSMQREESRYSDQDCILKLPYVAFFKRLKTLGRKKIVLLQIFAFTLLCPSFLFAQTAGDYRSVTSGNWLDPASWELLEEAPGIWSPATEPPNLETPSITIRSGHTITADLPANGNNIMVEQNGRLIIAVAPNTNLFQFSGNNINYGDITWIDGVIGFTSAAVSITNHGYFNVDDMQGNANMISHGTFTNASDGTFSVTTSSDLIVNSDFFNHGTFIGTGSVTFNNKFQNGGVISPAGPDKVGTLRIESSSTLLAAGSIINLDIIDNSGEGVGNDLLFLNTASSFNLGNTVLHVNDHSTAPVMRYTLIRTNDYSNNFFGQFSSYDIPQAYSAPHIDPTNVWIDKLMTTLPIKWGDFSVVPNNNQVRLYWTTLQETNTAYFEVERSSDGSNFVPIGRVVANGNSSATSYYNFYDNNKLSLPIYYYRLKQVDVDGLYTYSKIRSFKKSQVDEQVRILNNAVVDNLKIVAEKNIKAVIVDMNGRVVMSLNLTPGLHQINLSNLPSGVYNAGFSNQEGHLIVKRFVKM
ncbi:T9SS type A sorting domain-containing protein [Pinibacter aurantiacus]|uniref:T9SS type A sorting domain-containing protein n=1 Tax=Pinibacter aurantiacus TaxID=2851599 RepID=A0A9E2SF51_9BACT|nr:T9SS type A sorting domain-containing protein [Pinibacter aurantiacus]MBV4358975.1 T9SS type A sorting domain-containing protein [Pinibacter aurantiacus]